MTSLKFLRHVLTAFAACAVAAVSGHAAPPAGQIEWSIKRDGSSADQLVSMRIHGVSPDYARSLQRSGMTQVSADQLVRLRIAGFRP